MGITLTDYLLFGAAKIGDIDDLSVQIFRRKVLQWGAIATAVDMVVRGVPPLALPQAVANGIHYINAYGGTKLSYDIPVEYTQVDYAIKKGTAGVQGKFDTGIIPTVDDVKIEMKVKIGDEVQQAGQSTVGSFYACQARATTGSEITGISGSSASGSINGIQNGQSVASGIIRIKDHIDIIRYEYKNGNHSIYVKDLTTNTEDTQTGTYTFSAPTKNLYIFGNTTTTNNLNNNNVLYYCKIWVSGSLAFDAVPVIRNSDNVVGLYDKVSESFIEPIVSEGGGFEAGAITTPTPSDPMDIYCNNGKISVLDHTNWNIITNPTSQTGQGMFIDSTGKLQKANDRGAGVFIPVTVGKQYTVLINKKDTALGSIIRYGQSNNGSVPNTPEQLLDWYRGSIEDGMMISFTAKRPYFVMQLAANFVEAGGIDAAIEVLEAQGDNETLKLTPSNDTAGVANLLKIASDADTHEILTGAINHKIGIRVLDGTEDWVGTTAAGVSWYMADVLDKNMFSHLICTHFVNGAILSADNTVYKSAGASVLQIRYDTASDLTAFKSWLATQYSAGTPVIIVYAWKTPQDEVAPVPQTMQTVAGDNTLDIVQAGMSGLEVEVKYTTGVAVTITEVENAQLDDNITVTIA